MQNKEDSSENPNVGENPLAGAPWAKELESRMVEITIKTVCSWSKILNNIGEKDETAAEYVNIFTNQVKTLYSKLLTDMEMLEEKHLGMIATALENLQHLCQDLHVDMPPLSADKKPLIELYNTVMHKVQEYEALVEARKAELLELTTKQSRLCKALGKEPMVLDASPLPLPPQVAELRTNVKNLENMAMEREEKFFEMKEQIAQIVDELEIAPNLDFERNILDLTDSQVMISDDDMHQLQSYHTRVVKQKEDISEEIRELREKIDNIWDKLEINIAERDTFRSRTTGSSHKTLEILKEEVQKLEKLKKTNIKIFITKQRQELLSLWDLCHCSDQQKELFAFFKSDCYNEDLFDIHELEIRKWRTYYEENKELLTTIENHKRLWKDHLDLEKKSEAPNHYKNRGGQLLRDEKIRNKLKKQIPQCEAVLENMADKYFERNGTVFLSFGSTIQEYITKVHQGTKEEFKLKLSAKKQQRKPCSATTTLNCRTNLFVSPGPVQQSYSKRKMLATPSTAPIKKLRSVSVKHRANTGLPKLVVTKRRSSGSRRSKQRLSFSKDKENQEALSTSYEDFENALSRPNSRSTEIGGEGRTPQMLTVPPRF